LGTRHDWASTEAAIKLLKNIAVVPARRALKPADIFSP
jgi:hypothetical protein